ncbi:hypothetical protein E4U17_004641 [Claviceps sp. LM77 group G4]|nr:hypothetical protein E4U17_004641 [Claviceps sp. LM77 group G4]KAG6069492.1 hypothetical protein E4U16_007651 [Claviceps sp. LM84 group G4]
MDSLKAIILGASVVGAQSFSSSRLSNVTTSAGIAYTTEVVTALTTYCPLATTLTYGNKTYTVKSATTLTITDCPCTVHKPVETGTPAGGPECAKKCNEEYNACRVAPGANQSFCASKLASCVGYNPFTGGAFMSPTACAAGPAATGPAGGQGGQGGDAECAKKCNEEYNACRTAPDANMSFCASKLASCVGYNPFTGGAFMSPTACAAGPAATGPAGPAATGPAGPAATGPAGPAATGPAGPAGSAGSAGGKGSDAECAKKCNEEYNACRTAPDANMSFCASKLASCIGYNPFTGGSFATPTACSAAATQPAGGAATGTGANPPAVTAGAGQITPALALLALGAVALL